MLGCMVVATFDHAAVFISRKITYSEFTHYQLSVNYDTFTARGSVSLSRKAILIGFNFRLCDISFRAIYICNLSCLKKE